MIYRERGSEGFEFDALEGALAARLDAKIQIFNRLPPASL
jgi:hypothetical protein